jgi:hypothetical protein
MYTNTELHQLLYHVSFDHRNRGTSVFAEANEESVAREGSRVWGCVEGYNVRRQGGCGNGTAVTRNRRP